MANHKSALKRARQNELRRLRNRARKTRLKNATKTVRTTVGEESAARLREAQSIIDKAAKTSALHRKTAARKISRLARLVNKQNAS
ncbi:MAG: 30S ribosomal protein S20 [Desulfobacteraceae bacterium]|nr:30S ribosomal protein S20 [Desulfobacteraceae bacterium]